MGTRFCVRSARAMTGSQLGREGRGILGSFRRFGGASAQAHRRSYFTVAPAKEKRQKLKRRHAKRMEKLTGSVRPVFAPGDEVFDFVSLADGVVEEADHTDKWVKLVDGESLIGINDIGLIDPSTGIPEKPKDIRLRTDDETGDSVRVFQRSGHVLPFPPGHTIDVPERTGPRRTQDGLVDDDVDTSKVYKFDTKPDDALEVTYDPSEQLHPDLLYVNWKFIKKRQAAKQNKAEWKAKLVRNRRRKEQLKEKRRRRRQNGNPEIDAYIRRVAAEKGAAQ